jgi:hypothetical protein
MRALGASNAPRVRHRRLDATAREDTRAGPGRLAESSFRLMPVNECLPALETNTDGEER